MKNNDYYKGLEYKTIRKNSDIKRKVLSKICWLWGHTDIAPTRDAKLGQCKWCNKRVWST